MHTWCSHTASHVELTQESTEGYSDDKVKAQVNVVQQAPFALPGVGGPTPLPHLDSQHAPPIQHLHSCKPAQQTMRYMDQALSPDVVTSLAACNNYNSLVSCTTKKEDAVYCHMQCCAIMQ